ncbi:DUF6093 family protein [Microbacterium sp. 5K110]|jgi:hypothetical protein|uniref:DUF6093 family protein n=1 Tax=Microbacterium sp. 5K110 TaxID=2578104 RepID=UPI0010FD04D0|nr:DUF6093 family protein [Microbacterium sp. 5K110]
MAYDPTVLQRGRERAEQRMTETIVAGTWAMRTVAGKATRVLVTEKYSGSARVANGASRAVSDRDSASQAVATQDLRVDLPVAAPMLTDGDEIDVTGSTSDQSLVGLTFEVTGIPDMGQVTAHRYPVKEQT